jgi:hypothetical protein
MITRTSSPLITGHDLVKPDPADAPLEFTKDDDAIALARAWIENNRRKNDADAARDALEAHGFVFVRDDA